VLPIGFEDIAMSVLAGVAMTGAMALLAAQSTPAALAQEVGKA
jgi:hypothetical protein